jgi:ATP-dependent DNA helicase RecQ
MKMKKAQEKLQEVFGFTDFREGQAQVVACILEGKSALAVFPTGGGKSLCYQLPALMLDGMTLVVSPLIALMKDQIDFLVSRGVKAARMDSSLTAEESRAVWDALWKGELTLLYVAPERFSSERFLQRLRRIPIRLMVIDEAHCISEWGHNFRPDYMKLARLATELKVERVLNLTATATPSVAADICESFDIGPDAYVNTGFHRPNLQMHMRPCSPTEREERLMARLRDPSRGASIVYVTLQKTAEEVAARLQKNGIPALAYHAGLDAEARHEIQDQFMASEAGVVVATIAFGMGIDKANIRTVIHYNPPKSLENYMQETGRAGRDGKVSHCELLLCAEDVATLENFSYGDTPTREGVLGVLSELMAQADEFDVSVYDLAARYDIRNLVLSTLLTYMELEGILHSTGPHYNEYKFQPQRSSAEMFAGFDEERRSFLKKMFAQAQKGRTWFSIDLEDAAGKMGEDRKRLVSALNYLEEKGELELQVTGLRHGYRFLERPVDVKEVATRFHQRFLDSEKRDLERIQQVVDLAISPGCTVRQVLAYFGEALDEDCGHCDRCLGDGAWSAGTPALVKTELTAQEKAQIQKLISEKHAALATPRQVARFLCGLTSPATTRARLTRDPRFGSMAHHRFGTLSEWVQGKDADAKIMKN